MTTYVDVDRSAEAIQEDEELIEAVNQIVEKTAEIIYEDVKNDVSGFYLKVRQSIYTMFPFLMCWKDDRALFWDDMHKLAVTFALFVLAFLILSPSQFWVKKSSSWLSFGNKTSKTQRKASARHFNHLQRLRRFTSRGDETESSEDILERPQPQRRRSFSSVDYKLKDFEMDDDEDEDEDEEKEEERFAKMWPTIVSQSRYRSLVLPPECKRVDKPPSSYMISTLKEEKKDDKEQGDDDNPFDRLVTYWRHFLVFMVSMMRYDYGGAGWTLFYWLESLGRARKKMQKSKKDDSNDDDESESSSVLDKRSGFGTASAQTTSESSPVMKPRGRPRRKRDSIMAQQPCRETIDGSKVVTNENDTNDATDTPNVPQSTQSQLSTGDEEKKDCVDDSESTRTLVEESSISSPPSTPKKSTTTESCASSEPPTKKDSFSSVYDTPANDRSSDPTTPSDPVVPLEFDCDEATNPVLHSGRTKDALKYYRPATQRKNLGTDFMSREKNYLTSSAPGSFLPNMRGQVERRGSADDTYFFEAASTDESLRKMAVEIPVPDRNGYILGDEFLEDDENTPLLVFVNSRSGPQQGHLLITQLRSLLNPVQVWDLSDGGPEEALESFSAFTRLRILVCGGDGTVSWIISTIEKMKLQRWPPIAILPLGTGNDLARVHGWGGGYSNESLIEILEQVAESYISWLDRWEFTIENKKGKVKKVKSFFNYFGVGADAQMALQVHKLREYQPNLFFSRVINKAWYGIFGAEDAIKATSLNLPNDITLIADGVEVPLPPDSQGIILLNIDSYGGGVPLWARGSKESPSISNSIDRPYSIKRSRSLDPGWMRRRSRALGLDEIDPPSMFGEEDGVDDISTCLTDEERFARVTSCERPSSCQDGFLDVVSVRGSFHLGQIRVGLSTCQQLCQCRDLKIVIKRKVPVQLDGEPWSQSACTLHVKRKKEAAIMLHRSAGDSNGVETEMSKLLDWAEERSYIDSETHAVLMKEFSRRIENKTRERRLRSKDGLILSLKRAMESTGNLGNGGYQSGHNGIMF
ncbi:unnamed protein product [Cylindrotheca closterium]|uniref:Diacylglycerol kinase n=1 Tax=Cylindrotheca closterium TaxID=2856 RepID=A0AAD2FYD9_9STRA|nr:unnamed protein product [Cylindrotheca closterium]